MPGIPQLRPYQEDLVDEVEVSFALAWRAPMVVLPTGGGKTVVFSRVTLDEIARGSRVWIIAHRQELLAQASRTLTAFGIEHGLLRAGLKPDVRQQVLVASMQTLVRRLNDLPAPDLTIWDECHHSVSPTVKKILDHFPKARRLGVTATPCRLNGAGLGSVFDRMILGPTNAFLTENGYLSPAKYYAPPVKADLTKLKIQAGDYATKQSEEELDKPTITGDAISHYQAICDGQPMLVFCVSVAHAHHVAEQYRAAGYRAAAVDGKLSDEERDDRITGLGSGKYQVIASCDLIGEGLDVPSVTAVQLLRPTASLGLHLQQIGRGLRVSQGKEFTYVLDHVGNVGRMVGGRWVVKHGFASTEHQWTLESGKKVQQGKGPPTRTCEQCFSVHVARKDCPYCGYVYPIREKTFKALKMVEGKLVEVEQTAQEQRLEEKNATTFQELLAIGRARKYKSPWYWASKMFRSRPIDISDLP
jgi:DNA repair protein RadD